MATEYYGTGFSGLGSLRLPLSTQYCVTSVMVVVSSIWPNSSGDRGNADVPVLYYALVLQPSLKNGMTD